MIRSGLPSFGSWRTDAATGCRQRNAETESCQEGTSHTFYNHDFGMLYLCPTWGSLWARPSSSDLRPGIAAERGGTGLGLLDEETSEASRLAPPCLSGMQAAFAKPGLFVQPGWEQLSVSGIARVFAASGHNEGTVLVCVWQFPQIALPQTFRALQTPDSGIDSAPTSKPRLDDGRLRGVRTLYF
jgi:hypothetical protein